MISISALGSVSTAHGTAGFLIDKPGYYVVTEDLEVSSTTFGILILASNVTVDFDHHLLNDSSSESILVGVMGSLKATVRNGRLAGGNRGILARGEMTQVYLERLTIEPIAKHDSHVAVLTEGVRRLDISTSNLSGGEKAVSITSASELTVVRIERSRIDAIGKGIDAVAKYLVVRNSTIVAGQPVHAIGRSLIELNRVFGGDSDGPSIHLGSDSRLLRNEIRGPEANHCIVAAGYSSVIERNFIDGGVEAAVLASSEETRLLGNTIITNSAVGVRVKSIHNLLENNAIFGESLHCAIEFDDSRNAYRSNAIHMGQVCGSAIDGGVTLPTQETTRESRTNARSLFSLEVGSNDLLRRDNRASVGFRASNACSRGEATYIADWRLGEFNGVGAGLIIDTPGCYILERNLTTPPSFYGLVIISSDVTLNLNGYSIASDYPSSSNQVMIYVEGSSNVTLENGQLIGGFDGIYVDGWLGHEAPALYIRDMVVQGGDSSGYSALTAFGVGWVDIVDSHLVGVERGAGVFGETSGLIHRSTFFGARRGLEAPGFRNGIVRDNVMGGELSLEIGARNLIERNSMGGLFINGGQNKVGGNVIGSRFSEAIVVEVSAHGNKVAGNVITGMIQLRSDENVVSDNVVVGDFELIWVRGSGNEVLNNLVVGTDCGIRLFTPGNHQIAGNVVMGAGEGVCGVVQVDGGRNILPQSTCGNGYRGGEEICDGSDLGGETCESIGLDFGDLDCSESCDSFSTIGCTDCGNGLREGEELCDGSDVSGTTCADLGFDLGSVSCDASCTAFDDSGCFSNCGDGVRRQGEVCDGGDLGERTCMSLGFAAGELRCIETCRAFDLSGCFTCGNGEREATEVCDGLDAGGIGCTDLGFSGGNLECAADCQDYELFSCTGGCGNGIIEGNEVCDGSTLSGLDCGAVGFDDGFLGCDSSCLAFDVSRCNTCGNGVREGDEVCDGEDLDGETCASQGRLPGSLACDPMCEQFDYSGCEGLLHHGRSIR